jgi:hypothetical protein
MKFLQILECLNYLNLIRINTKEIKKGHGSHEPLGLVAQTEEEGSCPYPWWLPALSAKSGELEARGRWGR